MAAQNPVNKLLQSWFQLLDGNVTVNATTYPVYRTGVSATETGDYILLRAESATPNLNSATHVTSPVIITEVVTKFKAIIDDGLVNDIDNEIAALLYPSGPGNHNLPIIAGISVTSVIRENDTYRGG